MLRVLINNWWLFGLRGVLVLLLAIAVVFMRTLPQEWVVGAIGSVFLVIFFGVLAFIAGICTILAAVRGSDQRGDWWLLVGDGVVVAATGLVAISGLKLTLMELIHFLAFAALLVGVCEFGAARKLRRHVADEWFLLVAGLGSLGFGAFLFLGGDHYLKSPLTWLGAYALFSSLTMMGLAVRLRSLHNLPHILSSHAVSASERAAK
jgi:uncharacterized membrane protein HdeD (DUF308 family)